MARTPKRPSNTNAPSKPPATPLEKKITQPELSLTNDPMKVPPPLSAERCWAPADLSHVSFETTDELDVLQGVIEQDRAVRALELGLGIDGRSYNIYIAGASGTGKRTQLKNLLSRLAPQKSVPLDWVYVHNFKDPYAPVAISLKPGNAHALKKSVDELLTKLFHEMPKAFHSKEHQQKLQRIMNSSASRESTSLEDLSERVSEVGFAVKNTRTGLVMVPVVNDQALSKRELNALPEREKKRIEKQREKLDPLISEFIQKAKDIEQDTEKKLEDTQRSMGNHVSKRYIDTIRKKFPDGGEKLGTYLDGLLEHILSNLSLFLSPEKEEEQREQQEGKERDTEGYMLEPEPFVEFAVNVVVDNGETKGAPVIQETHPTFYRLFGKIERRVEQGIWFTDHRMIHAGAVAKANGGYLILHAQDVFQFPGVWETLKSTLRNREVSVEDQGETMGLLPTSGLKPEPIPVQLKLIMIGSNTMYHMLYQYDDDFQKLFQVKSDFDDEIKRDPEVFGKYARFIATAVKNNKLLPADRSAVAAVIEQSSRQVESQERLTLRFNEVANLMTEADFHARRENSAIVRGEHVELAIAERELRSSLIADKMYEELADGLILIDTKGSRTGVINGLAVYQIGDYQFGRPSRISARCYAGRGGIINVERQSRLSGSSHDKGVLILAGLLGDLFATERPLGLTINLAFEQSYGPIDGDSASGAEFYATLSALSNVPITQGIAVTGSINQMGEIQPIGGVNFKIEGFFRLCQDRGLDGTQGVIIPAQNVRHLMLSRQVREAVRAQKFFLWPIQRVEQGIELLMKMPAGQKQDDGTFPVGTLYRAVADRLLKLNPKNNKNSDPSG